MNYLTVIAGWDDVPQTETTTQWLGGPGGPANLAPQALANRDHFLLNRISDLALTIPGQTVNLVVTTNATTPYTKVDINADFVILKHDTLASLLVSGIDLTLDFTQSGANGLDTGTISNSTWYAVFVISDGSVTRCLASTSFTTPILPTDFFYYAHVGQVRFDSSGNIVHFYQNQRHVAVKRQNVLNAGAASSVNVFQALSVAAVVPPNAKFMSGIMGTASSVPGFGNGMLRVATTQGGAGQTGGNGSSQGGEGNKLTPEFFSEFPFSTGISTPQTLYWTQATLAPHAMIDLTQYSF